jgi:hypothetical protein
MSLLDDAKRLGEIGTIHTHYFYGNDNEECIAGCAAWKGEHEPDCPVLALPRIVAVLEAAERVAMMYPEYPDEADIVEVLDGVCEVLDSMRGEQD